MRLELSLLRIFLLFSLNSRVRLFDRRSFPRHSVKSLACALDAPLQMSPFSSPTLLLVLDFSSELLTQPGYRTHLSHPVVINGTLS